MKPFDVLVAIDWSAAAKPTTGNDSIWIAWLGPSDSVLWNAPTRMAAMAWLKTKLLEARDQGQTALVGFDFSFAYPQGTFDALGLTDWQDLWGLWHELISDAPDNANNRFEVASELNRRIGFDEGPFWGHPPGRCYANLGPKRPGDWPLPERRGCELLLPRSQPGWKLAYTGSVGSQALMGIRHLEQMRCDPDIGSELSIWPFQRPGPITFVELYPSLFPLQTLMPNKPKDANQVTTAVLAMKQAQDRGELSSWFQVSRLARTTEGWVFGLAEF